MSPAATTMKRRGAPQIARKPQAPRYWMHDRRLKSVMLAWFADKEMSDEEIAAMRDYLKQWISAGWLGQEVEALRREVDGLVSRAKIERWLTEAVKVGVDPL